MSTLRILAAAMGSTGVAMGAFGAHALKDILTKRGSTALWQTATIYQLFHATAILSLAAAASSSSAASPEEEITVNNKNLLAGKLMSFGNLLFSGSIYCLALGLGPQKLMGPMTPVGGLFMIGGWVVVGMS